MQPSIQSLAGLVYYSPDPQGLAAFYRERLGIPLAATQHGRLGEHREGLLSGVHFAIWGAHGGHSTQPLVPVFRTASVHAAQERLLAAGVPCVHKLIELGAGKRVVGFADPDGRAFRLIELDAAAEHNDAGAPPQPTAPVRCLSALVFSSSDPDRLATFYATHLGLDFVRGAHGPTEAHHEARLAEMRFAILPHERAALSSTFLINGLDKAVSALQTVGVPLRGPIMPLDRSKRLALFQDPDGNAFQLIDLGFAV